MVLLIFDFQETVFILGGTVTFRRDRSDRKGEPSNLVLRTMCTGFFC
jgi:hypothetical protein